MSALDVVTGLARQRKTTGSTPECFEPELEAVLDARQHAAEQCRRWSAEKTTAEDQLRSAAARLRLAACRRDARLYSTIRINGRVTYTEPASYSKVPEAALGAVDAAGLSKYVRPELSITLRPEFHTEQGFGLLLGLLGEEEFGRMFEVTRVWAVVESFHRDLTLRPEVADAARHLMEGEILKPAKGSFKDVSTPG